MPSTIDQIKNRRYKMEVRLDQITKSSTTPDLSTSVHLSSPKRSQKSTITSPNSKKLKRGTGKRHYGHPFNEE